MPMLLSVITTCECSTNSRLQDMLAGSKCSVHVLLALCKGSALDTYMPCCVISRATDLSHSNPLP